MTGQLGGGAHTFAKNVSLSSSMRVFRFSTEFRFFFMVNEISANPLRSQNAL